MTDTHWIERTSPKGMPFVGTCPKCGKKGLTVADANKPCENIIGLTKDQSLIGAITGSWRRNGHTGSALLGFQSGYAQSRRRRVVTDLDKGGADQGQASSETKIQCFANCRSKGAIMTLDIAAIKARADKAAAGPWAVYMDDYTVRVDQSFIPDQIKVALCATGNNVVNNASFIAHARADIPALIAALEAAERERDALKAAAKE